jgi:hypothetical protein
MITFGMALTINESNVSNTKTKPLKFFRMNLTFSHLIAAISTDKSSTELLLHESFAHKS